MSVAYFSSVGSVHQRCVERLSLKYVNPNVLPSVFSAGYMYHTFNLNIETCHRSKRQPLPAPVVGLRPQRPPNTAAVFKYILPCELKTYSHTTPSHLDQRILLELLHLEYPLVVYLYSRGEQPAVRNGENPSAEGGMGVKGWVLPLPLYVK